MSVTIYDIARKTGVSAITVSRALRGDPRVKGETAARILRCADKLAYIPNLSARALQSGRTRMLGMLMPSLDREIEQVPAGALSRLAWKHGYSLIVTMYHSRCDLYEQILEMFAMMRVDGIFVIPPADEYVSTMVKRLASRKMPLVFLDREPYGFSGSVVVGNNYAGAAKLAAAGIAAGAVGVVNCYGSENSAGRDRSAGSAPYALERIPDDGKIMLLGDYQKLPEVMRKLKREHPRLRFNAGTFDYWKCETDGFDEIFVMPQDFPAMADAAFRMMTGRIASPDPVRAEKIVIPELEVRKL